jgi:predicted nucleic acid-binding protein
MEANEILDTSVAMERTQGLVTMFTLIEYPSALSKDFTAVYSGAQDYSRAVEIAQALQAACRPIGANDMLIAAFCINRKVTLLTKDKDFASILKVAPQFSLKLL